MKFQSGDLVKWISEYDDYIVKDAGHGIIIGSTTYSYQNNKYTTYDVYRNRYNDKMSFEERNIQKIKGE
jgi:hypothetical protein